MEVKEAVSRAKHYPADVFSDEEISDIRLEEVEFDKLDRSWLITLGFLQPDFETNSVEAIRKNPLQRPTRQIYKIVRIPESDSEFPSMKTRVLGEP
ncbi:hypothetical protein [Methylobacterium frigidaeris]|uniref:hypothetical protein n=1 Tax=Methylobacterium frigidaeris TaxID=2038277 RepID=UPI000C17804A|nr:hypothetical protein [Methylobacterium frigidaeris]PIK68868.1 hypothetical protein CS379_32820 [Methylobacterium frigidaeris]